MDNINYSDKRVIKERDRIVSKKGFYIPSLHEPELKRRLELEETLDSVSK